VSSKKRHNRPNPLFLKTSEPDEVPPVEKQEGQEAAAKEEGSPKPHKPPQSISLDGVKHRKRRATRFLDVYRQFSSYIHKDLEPRFNNLINSRGVSKTELFNEAIEDILEKYGM
jgi:hypothetical protein